MPITRAGSLIANADNSGDIYVPANAEVAAYVAGKVIKASPGRLIKIHGYNSKGSAQFIQIHNASAAPADTSVPVLVKTAAATSNFEFVFEIPRYFSVGIYVCNSSTGPTKTIGSADIWIDAQYE